MDYISLIKLFKLIPPKEQGGSILMRKIEEYHRLNQFRYKNVHHAYDIVIFYVYDEMMLIKFLSDLKVKYDQTNHCLSQLKKSYYREGDKGIRNYMIFHVLMGVHNQYDIKTFDYFDMIVSQMIIAWHKINRKMISLEDLFNMIDQV